MCKYLFSEKESVAPHSTICQRGRPRHVWCVESVCMLVYVGITVVCLIFMLVCVKSMMARNTV